LLIAPGSNFTRQSLELARLLGAGLIDVERKIFPDGEMYVRLKSLPGDGADTVIVANSMYPNQDSSLLETLLLLNAAQKNGAKSIILVTPYLAYMRQDKIFLHGEPVSAEVVLNILSHGINKGVVVDVHNPSLLEGKPWINMLVSDILVEGALKHVSKPVVIAPDKGALERAKYAAAKLGLDFDYLIKERDRVTGEVSIKPRSISVENRDVVIVDDIISTGGTLAEAARFLISQGARRVVVVATHGLLVGGALRKIRDAGISRVVLADTLGLIHEDPILEYVNIAPRLREAVEEVLSR